MEFHISGSARVKYQFDLALFKSTGDAVFADIHAAQLFAHKMNQKRVYVISPQESVQGSDLYAMGLLDEIYHIILSRYERGINPDAMGKAYAFLAENLRLDQMDDALQLFNLEFPPLIVYQNRATVTEYLSLNENGRTNRINSLEEMLVLWLENQNPAFEPFSELFNDDRLIQESEYRAIQKNLYAFFDQQPKFGPKQLNLVDFMLEPSRLYPHSLRAQLEYIQENWGDVIGDILVRLVRSLDYIREYEKVHFMGPGESHVPEYDLLAAGEVDVIKFAEDRDWMPRLVLLAKNAYVWLAQLAKKYNQPIHFLSDIPDEELNELREQGFTGLWLIGLWERSSASARIKQMCGNPEAIASAYSLYSYDIAEELGGNLAYENLRHRAIQRGIRLGSDMVPNHMGIDSPWVIHHPDWFIQLNYPPFPAYRFNGPNLSSHGEVEIFLEDHYYDRTDAAVVFRLRETQSGRERYIYHGNDGTSMPWNDTAQLNYLDPAVRNAVIDTIVEVAKKFPIIRFDAAMTLTKRHYQRLWFPEPGSGGDIPTRSEYGLTKEQFDAAMPEEFWREVVARIEQEAPDTLLLAEAFWMMEGYFVRSLGMHRVYNSAFMNMLRDEENAKYRELIKKTLEFEPQILQRYVNFMNNPDEKTAVEQFGKGDKYFGICILMATFPGLPMFGHGQIEGYSEKYGMEFKKPYWDEFPDPYLVQRHRDIIFPLLHQRALFSSVADFRLFDFYQEGGGVNEDVFAYTNRNGFDRGLVIYHNRFAETSGWLRISASFAGKQPGEKEFDLRQSTLMESLGYQPGVGRFIIFRDAVSGLEFIRSSIEMSEQGLHFHLHAYESHVFIDFHEVLSNEDEPYETLCEFLGGRGVRNMREALTDLAFQAVKAPFREIANPGYFRYLLGCCTSSDPHSPAETLREVRRKMDSFLDGIEQFNGQCDNRDFILNGTIASVGAVMELAKQPDTLELPGMRFYNRAIQLIKQGVEQDSRSYLILLSWAFLRHIGSSAGMSEFELTSKYWIDEWELTGVLRDSYRAMDYSDEESERMVDTVKILVAQQCWYERGEKMTVHDILAGWLKTPDIQRFIHVNTYNDIQWFGGEQFDEFAYWMLVLSTLQSMADSKATVTDMVEHTIGAYEVCMQLDEAKKASQYRTDQLLKSIRNY